MMVEILNIPNRIFRFPESGSELIYLQACYRSKERHFGLDKPSRVFTTLPFVTGILCLSTLCVRVDRLKTAMLLPKTVSARAKKENRSKRSHLGSESVVRAVSHLKRTAVTFHDYVVVLSIEENGIIRLKLRCDRETLHVSISGCNVRSHYWQLSTNNSTQPNGSISCRKFHHVLRRNRLLL
jgi:hypothetical protein